VLQHVTVCCSALQFVPEDKSCLASVSARDVVRNASSAFTFAAMTPVLQCVAECCSALQCVAVCCSVLQCVAVCCSVFQLETWFVMLLSPSLLRP